MCDQSSRVRGLSVPEAMVDAGDTPPEIRVAEKAIVVGLPEPAQRPEQAIVDNVLSPGPLPRHSKLARRAERAADSIRNVTCPLAAAPEATSIRGQGAHLAHTVIEPKMPAYGRIQWDKTENRQSNAKRSARATIKRKQLSEKHSTRVIELEFPPPSPPPPSGKTCLQASTFLNGSPSSQAPRVSRF